LKKETEVFSFGKRNASSSLSCLAEDSEQEHEEIIIPVFSSFLSLRADPGIGKQSLRLSHHHNFMYPDNNPSTRTSLVFD
jgi:hypothetical protein